MKMKRMYMPTLRDIPSDAELPSHQLLLRAGMIRKLVAGVYSFLPLGYRVFRKIEQIVREEMDAIDGQEVLMSAIQPSELWEESGRWSKFGPEMFRLSDRYGRAFCLGPTHEEIFTNLVKNEITSYKQLPLNLYQIQTKYRDEKRPRFGLIRAREFAMKDAYTFDINEEGMQEAYKLMWEAYENVFSRCKLDFKVVEGDGGAMGDGVSHEFVALSEFGEGIIAYCESCGYAATDEKAEVEFSGITKQMEEPLEKIYTPGVKTIGDLDVFLGDAGAKTVKTLLYKVKEEIVGVMIPGHRTLNEVKLVNALAVAEHELEIASEEDVKRITGCEIGFAGPVNLAEKIRIFVDSRVPQMDGMVVGANETDYHLKNVVYGRDFVGDMVQDFLLIQDGDLCPKCGVKLTIDKGVEVGNIFQLRKKYSESMGLTYLDENGKSQHMWMGSHGIGISRTMAAIVEQYHDEKGICWPINIAPYKAIVTIVDTKKEDQMRLGEDIYKKLKSSGIETLLDDRKERAGVKFKDAELIGIPLRITVGRDAKDNKVEIVLRKDGLKMIVEVKNIVENVLSYLEE